MRPKNLTIAAGTKIGFFFYLLNDHRRSIIESVSSSIGPFIIWIEMSVAQMVKVRHVLYRTLSDI
jgi:hypothetical protein